MLCILAKLIETIYWAPVSSAARPTFRSVKERDGDKGTSSGKTVPQGAVGRVKAKTSSHGQITAIHAGYGLIDGHIYFDLKTVLGGKLPKEGDHVIVTTVAFGDDDHDEDGSSRFGSVAETVKIVDDFWDLEADGASRAEDWENAKRIESIMDRPGIGHVQRVESDRLHTADDVSFSFKDLTFAASFEPRVGDWILLKPAAADAELSGDRNLIEVSPLRMKSFKGRVTGIEADFAVVENVVYFDTQACDGGYVPIVGDIVQGMAIENSARSPEFEWRFTKFAPLLTVESQRLTQQSVSKLANLTELFRDKRGMVVATPLDFGIVYVGECKYISAFMRNEGSANHLLLNCGFIDNSANQFQLTEARLDIPEEQLKPPSETTSEQAVGVLIPPRAVACVNIIFDACLLGKTRELLVFQFDGFSVGRHVFAHVKDPKQTLIETNNVPHVRSTRDTPNDFSMDQYVKDMYCGPQLLPARYKKKSGLHLPVFLPRYPIPMELLRSANDRYHLINWLPCLKEELTMGNYKIKLSSLLHLEEIQMAKEMSEFDMHRVSFRRASEYLVLEVPGLSEGRPSVLVGDCIIASDPEIDADDENTRKYEGCIHDVRGQEVYLQFHELFHSRFAEREYNVSFRMNRTPLRRCHQAIGLWRRVGPPLLFPEQCNAIGEQPNSIEHSRRYNRSLIHNKRLNERQLQAVRCIVEGHGRPAPYIIYGPPGTGKTVTLVEAALQVFLQQRSSRIIVCAPSNSAADLVCERLHETGKFNTCDLVRLNAHHRKEESLSEIVRHYSDFSLDHYVVLHYRIIVTTCVTSGLLYALGVRLGHFTHIFIDEAGQSTEPEALISICLAAATGSDDGRCVDVADSFQVILAGDPKQLGPVLRSSFTKACGLQTSLLERLTHRRPYRRDKKRAEGYDPLYVTKLVQNYRSREELLCLPSQLFYDSELVATTQPTMYTWERLPNRQFPIVFRGVKGEDIREMDSPSWFNSAEVLEVVSYLKSLYNDLSLKPDDIGIVTPYRKQVDKIRLMIDRLGMEAPKVGSVEEFQGQERTVIIVSTVRSSHSWVRFDESHNLGFVFNEKRFNVTMTRARSLLVIVGNPFILIKDPVWRSFMRYCYVNKAYDGCEIKEVGDMLLGCEQDDR